MAPSCWTGRTAADWHWDWKRCGGVSTISAVAGNGEQQPQALQQQQQQQQQCYLPSQTD